MFIGPVVALVAGIALLAAPPTIDRGAAIAVLLFITAGGAALGGIWSGIACAVFATSAFGLAFGWLEPGPASLLLSSLGISLLAGRLRSTRARLEQQLVIANDRLHRATRHDSLTGLLDRRGFEIAMRTELGRTSRTGGHFALLTIEIGGLKEANDRLGRSVGDTILQELAEALGDQIRESDVAGRLGGDEFAAMLPDADRAGADLVAQRVAAGFEARARGIAPALAIRAVFGTATFPADGTRADALLTAADRALQMRKTEAQTDS